MSGVLIPMSQDTRVLLGSDNLFNVIIVTTRFGQGHYLLFAHNSY